LRDARGDLWLARARPAFLRPTGRRVIVAAGLVLCALGLVLVFWDKRAGRRRRAPRDWTDVPGRVVEARVIEAGEAEAPSGARDGLWAAEVAYAYVAGGAERTGLQTRFRGVSAASLAQAERIVAAYPKGAPVEVAVDPEAPERSVLAYDPPQRGLIGLGLVVLSVGLLLMMAR
jgi:hypothetical protein